MGKLLQMFFSRSATIAAIKGDDTGQAVAAAQDNLLRANARLESTIKDMLERHDRLSGRAGNASTIPSFKGRS